MAEIAIDPPQPFPRWARRASPTLLFDFTAGALSQVDRDGTTFLSPLPDPTDGASDFAPLTTVLANIAPKKRTAFIILPRSSGLARVITLPKSARSHMRAVVGHQLDQLTPFPADQVYYDTAIMGDAGNGHMNVLVAVGLKETIDTLMVHCRSWNVLPSVIVPADIPDMPSHRLNLLPQAGHTTLSFNARWIYILAGANLLIAALGIGLLIFDRQQELQDIRNQREAAAPVQPHIDASEKRRRSDVFVNRMPVSNLLALLDVHVPVQTEITRFQITNSTVTLKGFSDNPKDLLHQLEQHPQFQDVHFVDALVLDAGRNHERFRLAFTLRGRP